MQGSRACLSQVSPTHYSFPAILPSLRAVFNPVVSSTPTSQSFCKSSHSLHSYHGPTSSLYGQTSIKWSPWHRLQKLFFCVFSHLWDQWPLRSHRIQQKFRGGLLFTLFVRLPFAVVFAIIGLIFSARFEGSSAGNGARRDRELHIDSRHVIYDQRSRRAGPWSILPMDGIIRSILNVSLLEYSMFRLNGTTDNAAWKAHFGR